MKKIIILAALCLAVISQDFAQSYIYTPQPPKPKKTAGAKKQPTKPVCPYPEKFHVVVDFESGSDVYSLEVLDLLDSAYRLAFDKENPRLYAMIIESYGNGDDSLDFRRVDAVYQYFTSREKNSFLTRIAKNKIYNSCSGDDEEILKYEVPVDRKYYNMSELPASRKNLDGKPLDGKVLLTFVHNPEECIGGFSECAVPAGDSLVRGYYSSVFIPQGMLYRIKNTKDKCPDDLEFSIEEHMDYKETLERYFLIPHKKQILLQVGYIVLRSNYKRDTGECVGELPDSIMVRFPITPQQWQNKIRIYGKKYSEKGVEYKGLTTKKMASKVTTVVQAAINATQIDTIFLGKRIKPEEVDDYFFPVKTNVEEGSFAINGEYYKAYRINKHGEYEMRPALQNLFRIETEEQPIEEEKSSSKKKQNKKYSDDEEIE